jgi:hypothetical protein
VNGATKFIYFLSVPNFPEFILKFCNFSTLLLFTNFFSAESGIRQFYDSRGIKREGCNADVTKLATIWGNYNDSTFGKEGRKEGGGDEGGGRREEERRREVRREEGGGHHLGKL